MNKTYELDKICRVCLAEKKDMRPLFGELVADMLMEVAKVEIENSDGWPDKICIQCVHQVSRCHAFKLRVEKSDEELRNYIKTLTVFVEIDQRATSQPQLIKGQKNFQKALTPELSIENTQKKIHQLSTSSTVLPVTLSDQQSTVLQTDNVANLENLGFENTIRNIEEANMTDSIELSSLRSVEMSSYHEEQIVLTNENIQSSQIINRVCQPITQIVSANQLNQLIHSGRTLQVVQNGQPTQLLQIHRTSDDGCEIIVQQSDIHDEYFEDVTNLDPEEIESNEQNLIQIADEEDEIEHTEDDDVTHMSHEELTFELEPEISETDPETEFENEQEYEQNNEIENYIEENDPQYIAEFINSQITCVAPGLYKCNLCRKEFKQVKWLQTHMKSHSNWIKANCKKQPQCQICGRSFKGPGMLRMHMKTHETLEKIPTCSICEKTFKSKTILYRHRQTHQQKSYQCGNCLKHFSSPYTLSSHMIKKHSHEIARYQCSQCEEFFVGIDILKAHMQQTGHSIHSSKGQFSKLGST